MQKEGPQQESLNRNLKLASEVDEHKVYLFLKLLEL